VVVGVQMMADLTCGRCFRILSPDDVVESDGAGVALGDPATPNSLLQEEVTGFTQSGATLTFAGNGSSAIDTLAFTRRGRRSYRLALGASKLAIGTPAPRQLLLDIDSGEVCFRHVLHCKSATGGLSCR